MTETDSATAPRPDVALDQTGRLDADVLCIRATTTAAAPTPMAAAPSA